METPSSYRPHDPGHDYYAPGIYLITLVVRNRRENTRLLGALNDNTRQPKVCLTEIGKEVMRCWQEIPEHQARHGRKVILHSAVCMPDHFHGVIEVKERMDVSVGEVIRGFKAGCTMARCALQRPSMVVETTQQQREQLTQQGEQLAIMTQQGEQLAIMTQQSEQLTQQREQLTIMTQQREQLAIMAQPYLDEQQERDRLKRMSKKQRAAYYAEHPEAQQPLWDDNYDDTICLSDPITGDYCQRHFTAMVQYVDDNARRALMRRMFPQFFERCLHVRIGGFDADGRPVVREYAAFGNLFLLRWAKKVQVFCHRLARRGMITDEEWTKATASKENIRSFEEHAHKRKLGHFDKDWYRCTQPATVTAIDYTHTAAYREEHDVWVAQVLAGATVVVTPGISKGEQMMKDECIAKGYPLIHLQKEPIGALWKPEKTRFDACINGSLLILAPWKADMLGDVKGVPSGKDYSVFHNLNKLVEEICLFEGEAMIIK